MSLQLREQFFIVEKLEENLTVRKHDENHSRKKLDFHSLSMYLTKEISTRITSLNLSFCDLSALPKPIESFRLKELNISHNKLTEVPSCLYSSALNALEILDISYNQITHFEVVPNCVTTLRVLRLNNNCFQNIPSWFLMFHCISLEELNYSENKSEHYKFLDNTSFNDMKLEKLELKNVGLMDSDFSWLRCWKNLKFLDISNISCNKQQLNKFRDMSELCREPQWKNLQVLKLCNLSLPFLPQNIFFIGSLTELYLSKNLICWFPDGIENLNNLELLDISQNEFLLLPESIHYLHNLKVLIAHSNHLDTIPALPGNLNVLDLYDNRIENIDLTIISNSQLVDIDYNFVNLLEKNCDYEAYSLKKNQLRTLFNIKDRFSECKLYEETNDSPQQSSRSSEISSDHSIEVVDESQECINYDLQLEEDWDQDCRMEKYKHPNVSLSDEEFRGESDYSAIRRSNKPFYFILADEDSMFVDAD